MAETEDRQGHLMSLPSRLRKGIDLLSNGGRFYFDSNRVYKMPTDVYERVKDDPLALVEYVRTFITDHYNEQVERYLTLERYYNGDNDIHYWLSAKAEGRADNRIASGIPSYITNIRVGYSFGNAVKFQYNGDDSDTDTTDGDDITKAIAKFNSATDEEYHEKVMKKKLSITGRSFELLYVPENTNDVRVKALDPSNTFVVYDSTVEQHSLFAVYYYPVTFAGKTSWYVTVYTDEAVYHYDATPAPTSELTMNDKNSIIEPHYFESVPITEFINNDERMGDWERQLDYIDAYDKTLSEMANSQEDFSNSILVLTGDVETTKDKDGKMHPNVNTHSKVLWMKPKTLIGPTGSSTVITPTAQYLTKALPASDWQTFIDELMGDIHKYTNTPNVNDENFASNASGVAMSYKLWGSDQERAIQESLYKRGLMRRLRLLAVYWKKMGEITNIEDVENINPVFTPNLPKNDQEIVTNLKTLSDTGKFSDETLRQQAEPVTGVKPEEEKARVDDEKLNDPDRINLGAFDAQQPNQGEPVDLSSESDSTPESNTTSDSNSDSSSTSDSTSDSQSLGGGANGNA